jgi:hypothetical protein
MQSVRNDEWGVIERLLPEGGMEAARETRAFLRARYLDSPAPLLRILLFHAVNDAGMRETMAQARASGIAELSQVALFKRLRTAGDWLAWLGAGLCRRLRDEPSLPKGLRPRVVDSTTIQGPASKGITWRLHYALDLRTLTCDWFEVTDVHGGEFLERTPLTPGDVVLADRNFLRPEGVRAAGQNHGHVLIRMRWTHPAMVTPEGNQFQAVTHAGKLSAGKIGEWRVQLCDPQGAPIPGRVVAIRLPAPLAEAAKRRALRQAERAGRRADPRSLVAAQLVMLFTTLPESILNAEAVLELYRYRWQIELAFKRLKQLLQIGQLPHKDPAVARSWILAKLVIALLLETLSRNARVFSPWGYDIGNTRPTSNQPLALDCRVPECNAAGTLPFTRNPRTTKESRGN